MAEVAAEYGGTPAPVSGPSYITVDTLGRSRAEVDSQGNVTRHDYLPFGQEIPNSWGLRVYYNDYARADGFTRKFTGKERDAETGLDYFGARYMSGAQGRLTSPDAPLLDQHVLDPQSWNLYTYGRNNPLRYVDPTGQAIELIGDEKERKRALAALANSVGKDAGAKLYINEVKDGDETRYFVGVQGSLEDFAKMGDAAADLSSAIGANQVVEFGLTDKALPGEKAKGQPAYTYAPGEIGNRNVRVLINPRLVEQYSIDSGTIFLYRSRYGTGLLRDTTVPVAAWHEIFGHGFAMWQDIQARSSAIPGSSSIEIGTQSAQRSLDWENRMREILYGPLGPNNAKRLQH